MAIFMPYDAHKIIPALLDVLLLTVCTGSAAGH